uniref:Uncharacterized protein n=1 Tax=Anguilla anguilla TaxID=7936 RepID=A0A0E9SSC9_ANGAN
MASRSNQNMTGFLKKLGIQYIRLLVWGMLPDCTINNSETSLSLSLSLCHSLILSL